MFLHNDFCLFHKTFSFTAHGVTTATEYKGPAEFTIPNEISREAS